MGKLKKRDAINKKTKKETIAKTKLKLMESKMNIEETKETFKNITPISAQFRMKMADIRGFSRIISVISFMLLVFLLSSMSYLEYAFASNRGDTEKDRLILENSKKFHFVYFMHNDCPACKFFSPVLKNFAQHYNLKVFAYDVGEERIGSSAKNANASPFEKLQDQDLLDEVSPHYLPTLIAVDTSSKKWENVTENILTFEELRIALTNFLEAQISSQKSNS